jgi:hypothetical protein
VVALSAEPPLALLFVVPHPTSWQGRLKLSDVGIDPISVHRGRFQNLKFAIGSGAFAPDDTIRTLLAFFSSALLIAESAFTGSVYPKTSNLK